MKNFHAHKIDTFVYFDAEDVKCSILVLHFFYIYYFSHARNHELTQFSYCRCDNQPPPSHPKAASG